MITRKIQTISLWQPWASLIALNFKQYETRGWATNYRGVLAIHAAKRPVCKEGKRLIVYLNELLELDIDLERLPLGALVALTDLTDCSRMVFRESSAGEAKPPMIEPDAPEIIAIESVSELEHAVGDWRSGRYAWKLENAGAIDPIPYSGRQRLFTAEIPLSLLARFPALRGK